MECGYRKNETRMYFCDKYLNVIDVAFYIFNRNTCLLNIISKLFILFSKRESNVKTLLYIFFM